MPSDGEVSLRVVAEPAKEVDLAMLDGSLGPSTLSVFRARLRRGCQLCVLAKGEKLAGTLFFVFGHNHPFQHVVLTERDAVILDAWISPHLRGQGLYSVFLDLALGTLKGKCIERVFVATSEGNQPSLRALRRVGFRYLLRYRTRLGIYTYDVDALCSRSVGRRLGRPRGDGIGSAV
jgi:ribosomal protein S18 acetylase RimI-like enzyme